MDGPTTTRTDYAPLGLYGLAALALLLSLVAVQFEAPSQPSRGRTTLAAGAHPRGVRARIIRSARQVKHAPPALRRSPAARPTPVKALSTWPVNPVWRPDPSARRIAGVPLHRAWRARPGAHSLVLLLPGEPRWRADSATGRSRWGLGGLLRDPSMVDLAGAWELVRAQAERVPEYLDLWLAVARQREAAAPIIRSPSGAGPVITDPKDRLAMVPGADAPRRPQLEIRRRLASPAAPSASPEPTIDPVALRRQLERLTEDPEAKAWAERALADLAEATRVGLDDEQFEAAVERLSAAALEGRRLADRVTRHATAVHLRRASYAIQRRAPTWAIARRIQQREALRTVCTPSASDERVRSSLEAIAQQTKDAAHGDAWRSYLRTALVDQALGEAGQMTLGERRRLAQTVLARITSRKLNQQQRKFVTSGAVAALGEELGHWAAEPVDVDGLLEELEAYEAAPLPERAARIAALQRRLARSGAEAHRALAARIDHDYRNANLRLAIAAELLRRQLPDPAPATEPVRERIAGAPVRGSATTSSEVDVRLTPDPYAWRLAVEARGSVRSRTVASGGPARVHAAGATQFVALKPITVTAEGLTALPATCDADSRMRLMGVRTEYDNVLLVSDLIRARARREYLSNRARANRRAELRVQERLTRELDERASTALRRIQEQFGARFIERAERLSLTVEPLELRTTESRLITRLRLANERQLAAHTPRNRAPSDSVLSVQVHESAINNALEGLDLAGRATKAEGLRELLREKLGFATLGRRVPEEKSAAFLFGAQRPVRVEFADGRVHLSLSFDEMVVQRKLYRDFTVHAYYRAEATLHGAALVQDEPVQIEARIRASTRARLHGVFGALMPAGLRVHLVTTTPGQRERLAGLMVTQLVIEDGWLGVAVGPEAPNRVAQRGRYTR